MRDGRGKKSLAREKAVRKLTARIKNVVMAFTMRAIAEDVFCEYAWAMPPSYTPSKLLRDALKLEVKNIENRKKKAAKPSK